MSSTLISKLRKDYLRLKSDNKIKFNKFLFNYLNLSVFYGKDDRDFDEANFKLIKEIYKDYGKYKKFNFLNPDFYFSNFKEFNYSRGIILNVLIFDIFRLIKQLIDIFLIIIVIFIKRLLDIFGILKKIKKNYSRKKIYSIYYPKYIKGKSVDYYYPNLHGDENLFFIICLDKNKFISIDLLSSLFRNNFISPAKILGIRKLFLTVLQFIHLNCFELYLVFRYKKNHIFKFWYSFTKPAEKFYSLLVYNSIIEISKKSYHCEFISWYENQLSNRSFSLGVSYSKNLKGSFTNKLSTYNGTPFSWQYKRQFLPTKADLQVGFWGETYYVQDKDSFDEMKLYLSKNNISIKLKIVPEEMLRFKKIDLNLKKVYSKNRILTIFTHNKIWDLIACLVAVLNSNHCKEIGIVESIMHHKIIYIRLHPSLNKELVYTKIINLNILPKEVKLVFIDNKDEKIEESILNSCYSVFGISSYLNLAIKLDSFVLVVDTNHIDKSPIQLKYLKSKKLKLISPW